VDRLARPDVQPVQSLLGMDRGYMKDTRKYSVYPSDIKLLDAFKRLSQTLERMKLKEDREWDCNHLGYTVTLPGERRLRAQTFSEFIEILGSFPRPLTILSHSHWKSDDTSIGLDVDIRSDGIEVGVSGSLAVTLGVHDAVRDVFQASNPEAQRSPALSRYHLKKSVFLAHRFDDKGNAVARTVSVFLSRLGFQVIEGEGYESRDIPAKVADRIRSQDIFLLLATPGDTAWILSEAGFAKALDKYLVVLVQEDAPLGKGIIGSDHEHIAFPKGVVEKAFNDLLYALPR
jgi:hypothetical protein